jgi:hypothetical protein
MIVTDVCIALLSFVLTSKMTFGKALVTAFGLYVVCRVLILYREASRTGDARLGNFACRTLKPLRLRINKTCSGRPFFEPDMNGVSAVEHQVLLPNGDILIPPGTVLHGYQHYKSFVPLSESGSYCIDRKLFTCAPERSVRECDDKSFLEDGNIVVNMSPFFEFQQQGPEGPI